MHNKQVFLALIFALALSAPTAFASSTASCGWFQNAINSATHAVSQVANQTYSAIPQQSGSAIRQCLSEIDSIGGGIDWELPTSLFSSLMNQACTIGTNAVNNEVNTYVNSNVSYPGLVSANVGAGQSGVNFNVNNDSSSVASTLWNQALKNNVP